MSLRHCSLSDVDSSRSGNILFVMFVSGALGTKGISYGDYSSLNGVVALGLKNFLIWQSAAPGTGSRGSGSSGSTDICRGSIHSKLSLIPTFKLFELPLLVNLASDLQLQRRVLLRMTTLQHSIKTCLPSDSSLST